MIEMWTVPAPVAPDAAAHNVNHIGELLLVLVSVSRRHGTVGWREES
jgi:hypothetical protein